MKRSSDPTRTSRIRSSFRRELNRRVAVYLMNLRREVVDNDFLGLLDRSPMHPALFPLNTRMPPDAATKLQSLSNYAYQLGYATVVQEGHWMKPVAYEAFNSGVRAGAKWSDDDRPKSLDEMLLAYYVHELEGIVDAAVQRIARAGALAMQRGYKPAMLYSQIVAVVRKILIERANMLGHQLVVQQHNLGRIAQMRAAGFTHVGVIPESRQHAPRRVRDGFADAEEVVEVLTAGDEDVCEECEDIADSGPYTMDEAETLIPAHPRCRCAVVPVEDERFKGAREREEEREEHEEDLVR
jgi:hypothetical protein